MDKNYDVGLSNVIFICTSNEPSPETICEKRRLARQSAAVCGRSDYPNIREGSSSILN